MAKIIFGGGVAGASGSVAGQVFSRNKGGYYIRNRSIPTNPSTSKQTTYRAVLASLATGWRSLTAAQRAGWNTNAANFPYQDSLGQTKYYSGIQLYIKFNLSLGSANQAAQSDPPVPTDVPTPGLTGFDTLTDASIIGSFIETTVPADTAYVYFTSGGVSPGINARGKSLYRRLSFVAAAGDPEADLISEQTSVWGAPVVGQKIFMRVRAVSTLYGQSSPWISINSIVVASV